MVEVFVRGEPLVDVSSGVAVEGACVRGGGEFPEGFFFSVLVWGLGADGFEFFPCGDGDDEQAEGGGEEVPWLPGGESEGGG